MGASELMVSRWQGTATKLIMLVAVIMFIGATADIDCTWGKYRSNPYNNTVVNNGADKVKIKTCSASVCSSGTHKYVDCPAYVEAGVTETVSLDQGLHYMVFYDGVTKTDKECWPSSVGVWPSTLTLPLDPATCGAGLLNITN